MCEHKHMYILMEVNLLEQLEWDTSARHVTYVYKNQAENGEII